MQAGVRAFWMHKGSLCTFNPLLIKGLLQQLFLIESDS